jgi:hypothetical protein
MYLAFGLPVSGMGSAMFETSREQPVIRRVVVSSWNEGGPGGGSATTRVEPGLDVDHSADSCSSCVKLPHQVRLSGEGKMWEYGHFMLDFAPTFLEGIRQMQKDMTLPSTRDCIAVLANGVFMPPLESAPKDYHIREKFDFLFRDYNVKFKSGIWLKLPENCPEVPWKSFGAWVAGPPQRFPRFREFAFSRAGVVPPRPSGVIIIKRGKLGALRRQMKEKFFNLATKRLAARAISHKILDLEGLRLEDQIREFASTRVVVGQHGAGLSNALFMQKGSTVIEVGQRLAYSFQRLAAANELKYVHSPYTKWTEGIENAIDKAVL